MSLITVTIPVHNAMPYLPEAVESVLCQTLNDFRLIIIDDGSTDGSRAYLASLVDPRVTVIHQSNLGLGRTLNKLIALCETKYFARMDADDICDPRRLFAQIEYLEKRPKVVMLGTQIRFLAGKKLIPCAVNPLEHKEIRARLLHGKAGVCHPTIVVRADAAREVGGYRIGGAGEDVDFCLRMCEIGEAANLSDALYTYRLHANSIGSKRRAELHCGYDYAKHAADCRARRVPEPSFEEFKALWLQRPRFRYILEKLSDVSELTYRGGLVDIGEGRTASGLVRLLVAVTLRPSSALKRGFELTKGLIGRWI
jgi:glycosyltransferase involved in cell wall biosynthesis